MLQTVLYYNVKYSLPFAIKSIHQGMLWKFALIDEIEQSVSSPFVPKNGPELVCSRGHWWQVYTSCNFAFWWGSKSTLSIAMEIQCGTSWLLLYLICYHWSSVLVQTQLLHSYEVTHLTPAIWGEVTFSWVISYMKGCLGVQYIG